MVLELVVTKTADGYTAEVPSLHGCESWAHTEDEVMENILELSLFYLNIDDIKRLKVDRARTDFPSIIYKLIIK